MKKVLLILCIIFCISLSYQCMARCRRLDKNTCPNVNCPEGSFMGDDGVCYHCNEKKEISILCTYSEAIKKCPNRYRYSSGCSVISILNCNKKKENSPSLGIKINYEEHTCRSNIRG